MNLSNLVKYANVGYNVLLSGPHGVGKTEIIKHVFGTVFGEYYTNWRYFSASTLDPWVDFIGIPKNYTRADGKEVFGIVPPEHFTGEENIQAIFFDEINRADEKTLNALMELIQFKSINGRKFPNLKCIWAAANPADDEDNDYMVNQLDPAFQDRFEIQIEVPNKLSSSYFKKKFGDTVYKIASEWWGDYKTEISPRRLDKMLEAYTNNLPLYDFTMNKKININKLETSLLAIHEVEVIKSIIESGEKAIQAYFTVEKISSISGIFKTHPNIADNIYKVLDLEIAKVLAKKCQKNQKATIENFVKRAQQKALLKDMSEKQEIFINQNASQKALNIRSYNIDKTLPQYVATLRQVFAEKDIDMLSKCFEQAYNIKININEITTHHFRELVRNWNPMDAKFFIKSLAYFVHTNHYSNCEQRDWFFKFMGSSDFREFVDVDMEVLKKMRAINREIHNNGNTSKINTINPLEIVV